MFDAIRSLMQDLTNSERCAINDKILTSSEDLRIEVEAITAVDLYWREEDFAWFFVIINLAHTHTAG